MIIYIGVWYRFPRHEISVYKIILVEMSRRLFNSVRLHVLTTLLNEKKCNCYHVQVYDPILCLKGITERRKGLNLRRNNKLLLMILTCLYDNVVK